MTTETIKVWFEDDKLIMQYVPEADIYKREWVGLTEDDVNNALYKYHGWREFAAELERLLKEKNYG